MKYFFATLGILIIYNAQAIHNTKKNHHEFRKIKSETALSDIGNKTNTDIYKQHKTKPRPCKKLINNNSDNDSKSSKNLKEAEEIILCCGIKKYFKSPPKKTSKQFLLPTYKLY